MLIILVKIILDVWPGSEYASVEYVSSYFAPSDLLKKWRFFENIYTYIMLYIGVTGWGIWEVLVFRGFGLGGFMWLMGVL